MTPDRTSVDTYGVTTPGSLDGAEAAVLDESGRRVASRPLDDQRVLDAASGAVVGQVLGVLEDADPEWASSLPQPSGIPVSVTLVLPNGERFDEVEVLPPKDDPGGPLFAIYFPLAHPQF